MSEIARRLPEQTDTQLRTAEKAQFIKIYKGAQYLNFENIPFSGDKTNPLISKLAFIKKHRKNSIPGKVLVEFYNRIKNKLDHEHPILRRVFIGEMLKRLKIKGNAPGMVLFIKLVLAETKALQPILVKHVKELIMLVKDMPPSPYKEKILNELFRYGGIKKPSNRPGDSLFGEKSGTGEGGTIVGYGVLEGVESPYIHGEIMDQSKLDPFQLILYKRLLKGHNEFAKEMISEFSPLFAYHKLRYVKKAVYKAISDFADWIKITVDKMSLKNSSRLPAIYSAQLKVFKLPSLPQRIKVPAPFWAHVSPKHHKMIKKLQKKLTNIRSKTEAKVKTKLQGGLDTIKTLSRFAPILSIQLNRKKMYRGGPNRTFLNRFWTLAYRKFQTSKGDERLKYEFFTMALDSIKDDNELIQIKDKIKGLFIAILKFHPDAQKLSKRYFGKNFNKLSSSEISEIIDLLLPSRTVTLKQKRSKEYKDIVLYMQQILALKVEIGDIKKTNYPVYVAITTVSHNLVNIYTSLMNETDARKAKKKIDQFVEGFEAIKKLIGKQGMQKIMKKSPGFAKMLSNPKKLVYRLRSHFMVPKSVKAALTEFERIHNLKQPEFVKAALKRIERVEKGLLRLEKYYVVKRDQAFKKGKLNYGVLKKLQIVRADLRKVQTVINFIAESTREEEYKDLLDKAMSKNLYSTRYLKVSPVTQKYLSFKASEKARNLKPDYNNLFYVSKDVQGYVNRLIQGVYAQNGLGYASSRVSEVVKDIVLTYGYQKQKELGKQGAYNFLKNPTNRKAFVAEIVKRVNGFLKTAKLTDKKNKVVQIKYMTGTFSKHIDRYIANNIIIKARKSYRLQQRNLRAKQPA